MKGGPVKSHFFFGMKLDKNRRNMPSRRKVNFLGKMKLWKFTKSLSRRKVNFLGKFLTPDCGL